MRLFHILIVVLLLALFEFSLAFAEEFRYDSHGKRDPFISSQEEVGGQLGFGELQLEGVIVDPKGNSYAIVNNEIIREGDLLQGFLLKKIESTKVLFEKGGEDFEVVLREDDELLKEYLEMQENKESEKSVPK